MAMRRRGTSGELPLFVGLSILGHVPLCAWWLALLMGREPLTQSTMGHAASVGLLGEPSATDNTPLDVTLIEPSVLGRLASSNQDEAEADKKDKEKVEELKKQEEDPTPAGQVVDLPKPALEMRPDKADYVSQFDSQVDKETKSSLPPGPLAPPPPQTGEALRDAPGIEAPSSAAPSGGGKGGAPARALAMRESDPLGPAGSEDGRFAPEKEGIGSPRGREARSTEGMRQGTSEPPGPDGPPREGGEMGAGTVNLRPSNEALVRAVGGGSSDYLPDVDEGSQTLLNSKRWKYASFFNRVQRAVYVNWHPDMVYSRRDPTRQIYGHKNRMTVLKVTLRPDGTIRDILVEKPCGVDFLDDEAVSAMRDSQPFPNPPQGLIDKQSQLITFKFGFYFEIESSSSFRMFRYSN